MRPRRLSRPTRSERIRERRATSSEPSSTGTCTRRPSLVTTTATRRRSRSFQVGTVRAVYVAPVRCATTPDVPCLRTLRPAASRPSRLRLIGLTARASAARRRAGRHGPAALAGRGPVRRAQLSSPMVVAMRSRHRLDHLTVESVPDQREFMSPGHNPDNDPRNPCPARKPRRRHKRQTSRIW
jgi:hypothetical protein